MNKNNKYNIDEITVIVPCYNVEQYVERCIKSLLNQTYNKIKIILVDDYSTDNTRDIIKKYEKKYSNISAIYNKQNKHIGYSRNVAIQKVKTKYIAFIDSDDWVEPNFFQVLYDAITEQDADIAICDIYLKHDNPAADFRVEMYDSKPNRFGLINTGLAASSSNKLFKTSVLKSFKYPEGIINEDVPVVLAIMYKYKTVYTDKVYYNYYQRPGSTQNSKITSKRFDIFKSVELLKQNIGNKVNKKIWDAIVWHQIIQLFLRVLPRAKGIMHRKKLIKEFFKLDKQYATNIMNNHHLLNLEQLNLSNKIYVGSLRLSSKYRLFTLTSILMGSFYVYQKHKHQLVIIKRAIHAPIVLIKNPKKFFKKLGNMVFRKYVIKKDITIDDLIIEAKHQASLTSNKPVSAVIPNYNYEKFLIQRVFSILYQTEKVGEIIILDDNSTDDSVNIAKEIKKSIGKYVPIRLINNKQNQGTFRQWQKGFSEAKYDYIWIAEADDYCSDKFLRSTLKPLNENNKVIISYVDTGFVNEYGLFLDSVKVHIDYQESGHWDKDYVNNGIDEIKTYSYLNNTIANVSSVVFRKIPNIDYEELFSYSRNYKQAGDWVFYVNYMMHGDIAYIDKTYNYYRLHGSNVSSTTKAKDHLSEIFKVYDMLNSKLKLSSTHKEAQKKRIKFLKKAWNI